ncbi:hypothetical protein ACQEVM_12570 [Streptomyces sp. CA-243310]|uniref:hypothetical protein n=1 Tax=Streptomyces sp. CA-243310 TaxID=3240056 RepID=UPI003D8B54C6
MQNEQDGPADVDVVGYSIATRIGNNRADLFLEAMVGQLAAVTGRKKVPGTAGQPTREPFHDVLREVREAAVDAAVHGRTRRASLRLSAPNGRWTTKEPAPGRLPVRASWNISPGSVP